MENESCGNCKFWYVIDESIGSCKRFPPIIIDRTPNGRLVQDSPFTVDADWCGEWKNKIDISKE